ncbi:MAG TPA: multiubiquitin domain-containing protein [Mycobacterium sp.]
MEIFVHSAEAEDPQVVEVEMTALVSTLLIEIGSDGQVWLEDTEQEIDIDLTFQAAGISHHHHVHRSPCREIEIEVSHEGRHIKRRFAPVLRCRRVLSWAVEHLQLGDVDDFDLLDPRTGTVVDPQRHIGTLLHHTNCTLQLVVTHRRVRIVVNATAHTVPAGAISFDALVALAFPTPPGPNPDYTVRYSKGPRDRPTGTVARGHSVHVRNGMVFVVTATDKS